MSKRIVCICIVLFASYGVYSQGGKEGKWPHTPINLSTISKEEVSRLPNFSIDLQASYPFGKTGENLSLGVTARVGYTNNPFGFLRSLADDSSNQRVPGVNNIPEEAIKTINIVTRRVGWTAGAAYTYLPGKKEDYGGGTIEYDPMSIVHVYGGVNYDPCPAGDIELDLGPAMAFFSGGGSEFGFGTTLNGFWAFTSSPKQLIKIRETKSSPPVFGVSGGVNFYKFKEVDPLYTFNLGVRMTF